MTGSKNIIPDYLKIMRVAHISTDSSIVIFADKYYFVDIKTEAGKQTKEQKKFQKDVEARGFAYLIWRSIDDAIDFMNKQYVGIEV
jgi:hypothetical protein